MAHGFLVASVCYVGDSVCAYNLAQITGRETHAREEAGMGMGGLGELVWRAAKRWLTASVAKLATRRAPTCCNSAAIDPVGWAWGFGRKS